MPERLGDLAKLDHVQAAFASLYLGHEALGPAQTSRELHLRDAGRLSHRGDEGDELLVPLRENR